MAHQRIDVALVERGLFPSRAKAREAIDAGLVALDERVVAKASEPVTPEQRLSASAPYPWVSRGGVKLAAALKSFNIDANGKTALDVGASTGGFAHVLLDAGAASVLCVDVGHGQLHAKIAADPRVRSLEKFDARKLRPDNFEKAPDLIVCDVSFISLTQILPAVLLLAGASCSLVALIKPQFEAGAEHVKKGFVRDAKIHAGVCARVKSLIEDAGWRVSGVIPSPIAGGDGNLEFLIGARRL